jgi:hypothetical protein
MINYYQYFNKNVGERYFKVKPDEPVLQIISSSQKKKGRAFMIGVTYITYQTFIGSWACRLGNNDSIKKISKSRFDTELQKMIKKFRK